MTEQPQETSPDNISPLRRIGRGAKWLAHALILPVKFWPEVDHKTGEKKWTLTLNLKKIGVFFLGWSILFPAAIKLFPDAKQDLAKDGIPAEVIEKLAPGKKIHVVRDGLIGNMAMLATERPFILWPFIVKDNHIFNDTVSAFALPSPRMMPTNTCVIYIRSVAAKQQAIDDMQDAIKHFSQGTWAFNSLIPAEVQHKRSILHEIAHCSDQNKKLPDILLQEGDADTRSALALTELEKQPDLRDKFLLFAGSTSADPFHDTALYMYSAFNNLPIPSAMDMYRANRDAARITDQILTTRFNMMTGTCPPSSLDEPTTDDCTIKADLTNASAYTVLRVQLYQQYGKKTYIPLPRPAS